MSDPNEVPSVSDSDRATAWLNEWTPQIVGRGCVAPRFTESLADLLAARYAAGERAGREQMLQAVIDHTYWDNGTIGLANVKNLPVDRDPRALPGEEKK